MGIEPISTVLQTAALPLSYNPIYVLKSLKFKDKLESLF